MLISPKISADLDVAGIIRTIRSEGLLVTKTANFTMGTKEAEIFHVSSGTLTATAPPANSTDLQLGAKFLLINKGAGILTINKNGSGSIGSLASGESGLMVLLSITGATDANGEWELLQINKDDTGVTKFSSTFNADVSPTTGASWGATSNDAHSITVNPSAMVTANPVVQVFDASNEQVLMKVVATSNSSVTFSVPSISTKTTTFAGKVVIW